MNKVHLIHFNVITLFPNMIDSALKEGVVGQAVQSGLATVQTVNPRQFTKDVHHTVDDRPFGGGDGMVLLYEPLKKSMDSLGKKRGRVVMLSAHGQRWNDRRAREWAALAIKPDEFTSTRESASARESAATRESVVARESGRAITTLREPDRPLTTYTLVCGRYGGVDQRFINEFVDEEISIGDYILSGGELGALVLIDSVVRLLPHVLGHADSAQKESFAEDGLLEAPLFTRPQNIGEQSVPRVFLSGDHAKIAQARRLLSLLVTLEKRPDLISDFHRAEIKNSARLVREFSLEELAACGLHPEKWTGQIENFK